VKAKSIMKPLDAFKKEYGTVPTGALNMNENDDLSSLIETSVSSDMPIIINNSNNEEIGIVSQKDLLVAIVEGQDE
jgi:glycine betaine/proline transport system ATP-binding protein